jgi:hypothetical protein
VAACSTARICRIAAAIAVAAGYAYWATGLRPFTPRAYLAVAVPMLAVAVLMLASHPGGAPARSGRITLRRAWPWIAVVGCGCVIETVGLLLGGRSSAVPTLSTVFDHALRWHFSRWLLFCIWLALAWLVMSRFVINRRSLRTSDREGPRQR